MDELKVGDTITIPSGVFEGEKFTVQRFTPEGVEGEVVLWGRSAPITLDYERFPPAMVRVTAFSYQIQGRLDRQRDSILIRWWHERVGGPDSREDLAREWAEWEPVDAAVKSTAQSLLQSIRQSLAEASQSGSSAVRAHCDAEEARLFALTESEPFPDDWEAPAGERFYAAVCGRGDGTPDRSCSFQSSTPASTRGATCAA